MGAGGAGLSTEVEKSRPSRSRMAQIPRLRPPKADAARNVVLSDPHAHLGHSLTHCEPD